VYLQDGADQLNSKLSRMSGEISPVERVEARLGWVNRCNSNQGCSMEANHRCNSEVKRLCRRLVVPNLNSSYLALMIFGDPLLLLPLLEAMLVVRRTPLRIFGVDSSRIFQYYSQSILYFHVYILHYHWFLSIGERRKFARRKAVNRW